MSVFHTKGNSKMGYDTDALFERLHQELAAMTPQSPHTPSDSFYGAIPQEAPEAVQSHENESSRAVHDSHDFKSWEDEDTRCEGCGATKDDPEAFLMCQMVDIEPDYDAILLAARKSREAEYDQAEQGEREFWETQSQRYWARKNRGFKIGDYEWKPASDRLAAALSKPLTFDRRVGWKPEGWE